MGDSEEAPLTKQRISLGLSGYGYALKHSVTIEERFPVVTAWEPPPFDGKKKGKKALAKEEEARRLGPRWVLAATFTGRTARPNWSFGRIAPSCDCGDCRGSLGGNQTFVAQGSWREVLTALEGLGTLPRMTAFFQGYHYYFANHTPHPDAVRGAHLESHLGQMLGGAVAHALRAVEALPV